MIKKSTNSRYKLFLNKNEQFLIDLDTYKLTWIFPGLVWFLPMRVYQLNDMSHLEKIDKKKKNGKSIGGLILLSAFFTRFFSNVVPKDFWTKVFFPELVSIFVGIAICVVVISLLCRFKYSKSCQKKMLKSIELEKSSLIIFIKKNKKSDFVKFMITTFVLGYIIFRIYYETVLKTNIILILVITAVFNWYLYTNLTFSTPDIIDYKIIKKESE